MKMVKSLLLGSAAGLVAVAGAQAADLPVKAKPVEYVKVCSLYGAGFYYMPGTDLCLKIGGWVRAEYAWGANGNITNGQFLGNVNNRNTSDSQWRTRGYITADARQQTEWGTLRSYIAVGLSTNDIGLLTGATQTFSSNRAFIQFAGFTFGTAQSFYDYYSGPAVAYWGTNPMSDTGDPGWMVAAYTAQFGNGFSGTISAEQRRMTQIIDQNNSLSAAGGSVGGGGFLAAVTGIGAGGGAYGGFQVPDIVANLRVDQAWGGAQIMGALHEVNAGYYGNSQATGLENSGNPSTAWGFAAGAGLRLNADVIAKGDYFQTQFNYAEGAMRYLFFTPAFNWYYKTGNKVGYGVLSDGVYGGTLAAGGGATSVNLTTGWGVNASYEHFWTPAWRTSLVGGYYEVRYNNQANAILCVLENNGAGAGSNAVATAGCNNNWSNWYIGSRTQWNLTPNFYMGVEVLYQKLRTATTSTGTVSTTAGAIGQPITTGGTALGVYNVSDQDNVSVRFRVHRDFLP
jgi:hypothetical protein